MSDLSVLQKFERWYSENCDGSWENDSGVTIQSCDNPGWWVTIDLQGTRWENVPFTEVKEGDGGRSADPTPPWLHCYVDNNKTFNGAGDPMKLERIVSIFLQWCESHRKT